MTKQFMIDQLREARKALEKLIYDAQADNIDLDYVEINLKKIDDVIAFLESGF